jgi:YfiH family protein
MTFDMTDLPQPTDAFEWVQAGGGPALVCRPLAEVAQHLYTTRHWTLGHATAGDDTAAWAAVAQGVRVDPALLVRVHQVHGTTVVVAAPEDRNRHAKDDADIIVSHDAAHALAVQTADCVPLLIADRSTGAIAAAHAGWRGLAARVPSTAVAALRRHFGSRPVDLVAAVGPSIGACCYEVGADVMQRFQRAGFGLDRLDAWFQTAPTASARNPSMRGLAAPRESHWFFDGWAAARDQLIGAGVPEAQVFVAELCTASHSEAFCSYRRDGSPAGRLAATIRRGPRRP